MEFNTKDVRVHLWSKKTKSAGDRTASTGVEVYHMPTGLEVRADDGKSAMSSKEKAFRELKLRLKNLKPNSDQRSTMAELEAINDITQKIMRDFPIEAQGKLSTVLQVSYAAMKERDELKEQLDDMKAQYNIVKNLCDEFEGYLDQAPESKD